MNHIYIVIKIGYCEIYDREPSFPFVFTYNTKKMEGLLFFCNPLIINRPKTTKSMEKYYLETRIVHVVPFNLLTQENFW